MTFVFGDSFATSSIRVVYEKLVPLSQARWRGQVGRKSKEGKLSHIP